MSAGAESAPEVLNFTAKSFWLVNLYHMIKNLSERRPPAIMPSIVDIRPVWAVQRRSKTDKKGKQKHNNDRYSYKRVCKDKSGLWKLCNDD